jgi:hypothetical protein
MLIRLFLELVGILVLLILNGIWEAGVFLRRLVGEIMGVKLINPWWWCC